MWGLWPVKALALISSTFFGLANLYLGGVNCAFENTPCARADSKLEYHARLFTVDGRPLATEYRVHLGSREGEPALTRRTDPQGRVCLITANERLTTSIEPLAADSTAAVDPRFRGPEGQQLLNRTKAFPAEDLHPRLLAVFPEAGYLDVMGAPFRGRGAWSKASLAWQDSDRAEDCVDVSKSSPWYRYDGLTGSPQWLILMTLAISSVILLLRRDPHSPWRALGVAAAAAEVIAFLVLWNWV